MEHVLALPHVTIDLVTRWLSTGGRLSTMEAECLAFLAARPGEVVQRATLQTEVWGYSPSVRTRAIDATVRRLRQRVEREPRRPEHLLTVHGVGYRFEPGAPAPPETLPGRSRERAQVLAALDRRAPVTLVGAPGVGKSALGRAIAEHRRGKRVDLAALRDEQGFEAALADALGVPIGGLDAALAARRDLLLLDDADHVLASVRERLAAPAFPLLVTSRTPTGAADEQLVRLGPLPLEAAEELVRRELRRLGLEGGSEASRRDLVELLEGHPLALRLAVRRLDLLSVDELTERLRADWGALPRDEAAPVAHHRSLAEAVRWSVDALEPAHRRALVELAAFRGSFPIDAAEAVVGPAALDVLSTLVRHSLVETSPAETGRRLALPAPVRAHIAPEVPPAAFEAVDGWLVQRVQAATSAGAAQRARLVVRLAAELPELQAAVGRSPLLERLIVLGEGLEELLGDRLPDAERRAVAASVRERAAEGPDALRARACLLHCSACALTGRHHEALEAGWVAQRLFEILGDTAHEARVLQLLGNAHRSLGDKETCFEVLRRGRRLATGDEALARAELALGIAHGTWRELAEAERHYRAVLVRTEGGRAPGLRARALSGLAVLRFEGFEVAEALRLQRQALAIFEAQGEERAARIARLNVVVLHVEVGELEAARQLGEPLLRRFREVGQPAGSLVRALARALRDQGELASARVLLEDSGATDFATVQGLADAQRELGVVALLDGQAREALRCFTRALDGHGASRSGRDVVVDTAWLVLARASDGDDDPGELLHQAAADADDPVARRVVALVAARLRGETLAPDPLDGLSEVRPLCR